MYIMLRIYTYRKFTEVSMAVCRNVKNMVHIYIYI